MATLLGSIDATPTPDHCMITIIGGDFDSFGHPDTNAAVLCWAGTEQIQLFSEISDGHRPHVTVEAWDGPAPTDTENGKPTDTLNCTRPAARWVSASSTSGC
ncbi:hypothetical protein [Micromonospora sp. NPDC000442]|uniref:hypothetical protein n=1 Tax=Micromonospora sp. NPDC000442 TaxID=3364217 RepID=UPI0036817BDD